MPAKHATQRIERACDLSSHAAGKSHGSTSESNALFLVGLACMGFGLALAIGPRFSWQAKQIATLLTGLGVHGGAVAIGGLVLMAVARVRRHLSVMDSRGASNEDLLFEQVASDMVQTRNALEHLQGLIGGMQAEISGLSAQVNYMAAKPPPPPPAPAPTNPNDDAIYGLAASLDKLGARLEQRLKAQHDAQQASFEEMNATLLRSHRLLEESAAAAAAVAQAQVAVQFAPAETVSAPEEPQAESSPLGLLDRIDDYGASDAQPPTELTMVHDTHPIDELRRHLETDVPHTGTSSGSWEEELDMVESPSAPSKLEQLRALLADDEVRAALESWQISKPQT